MTKKKEAVAPEDKPLTELEERFVHYYLLNPKSAGQAWIKAGGEAGSARQTAHQAMQRPRVKKAIDLGRDEIAKRFKVTEERVIQELSYLAFSDPRDVFDENGRLLNPDEWSSEAAAAISSLEVVTTSAGEGTVEHVAKLKRWDKGKALDMLAKHLGLFVEKHEVTGKNGGPIEVKDTTPTETARIIAFALAKGMKEIKGNSDE